MTVGKTADKKVDLRADRWVDMTAEYLVASMVAQKVA